MTKCVKCAAPLAPDQKYCVSCGVRRGALPNRIARAISAVDVSAYDVPAPPLVAGVPPTIAIAPGAPVFASFDGVFGAWIDRDGLPSPRLYAVALMAMLAFGVLLGSAVGQSRAGAPIYAMAAQTPAPVTPPEVQAEAPAPAPAAAVATEPAAAPVPGGATAPTTATQSKVNHVWLIVLSDQGFATGLGDSSSDTYMNRELNSKGELIENHYAVAQGELANMIALISGQGPTWQIARNCPVFDEIAPATVDFTNGQVLGDGCVFPETVRTLPEAIAATGRSARAYIEGSDTPASASGCRRPALGETDPDHTAEAGNAYVTWSNPLVYFRSITKIESDCALAVTGLGSLDTDLAGGAPAFSLIVPDRCHSGSDVACAPGAPAGVAGTDELLRSVVDKITASKSYADGGLIAITFDQAPQGVGGADVSSCCGQPAFPNLAVAPSTDPATFGTTEQPDQTGATGRVEATGQNGATGQVEATGQTGATGQIATPPYTRLTPQGEAAGGGKVGLLLISPLVKPGTVNTTDSYNHFSLLASIEQFFGTEKLGYTALPSVTPFDAAIFNASAP